MEGGQSSTYLRQTRVLPGPWVSVTETERDETKRKFWPDHSDLPQQQNTYSFLFCFISMSQRRGHVGRTMLLSVLGKSRSVPLPFLFVFCLSRFSLLHYTGYLLSVSLRSSYYHQTSLNTQYKQNIKKDQFCLLKYTINQQKITSCSNGV